MHRGFLHHVAMQPQALLGWLWGTIGIALFAFVSLRVVTSDDVVDVQQWSAEEVQRWFETYDEGLWKQHAAAFSGLDGKRLAALTKEDFERKLASTGDAIFNDWRLYVAEHSAWGVATAMLLQAWVVTVLLVAAFASVWLIQVRATLRDNERKLAEAEAERAPFEARDDITQFLRSLEQEPRADGDAEYLALGGFVDMWNVFSPDETRLFLRPCYTRLCEELRHRQANLEWVTNKSRQLILGTPGTGKSYFRLVLAREALFGEEGSSRSESRPLHVVLVKCCDPGKADTFVNRNGVVLSRSAGGSLLGGTIGRRNIDQWCASKLGAGERVLTINDVSHGVQDLVISDGRVEVYTVSSNDPRVENTHEANKRELYAATRDGLRRRVRAIQTSTMPLWSVEEAVLCRRALRQHLTEESVKANMLMYGMTARDAFARGDGLPDLERHLRKAHVFGNPDRLSQLLRSEESEWYRLAQDRLFHRETGYDRAIAAGEAEPAGDHLFDEVSIEWRSSYVRDIVVNFSLQQAATAVRQAIADPQREAGVVGSFVEATFLRILRLPRGTAVAPRYSFDAIVHGHVDQSLSALSADALAALEVQREAIWFANGREDIALAAAVDVLDAPGMVSGVLLQPYDTRYPAIDAVLVVEEGGTRYFLLLQATIAAEHPTRAVAGGILQTWVDLAVEHDARFGLVFVLPPTRYSDFVEQRVEHEVDGVLGQYKLCVVEAGL